MFDNTQSKYFLFQFKGSVKYLVILIDNKPSWKSHFDLISTKISKIIGLINRLQHIPCNQQIKSQLFNLTYYIVL